MKFFAASMGVLFSCLVAAPAVAAPIVPEPAPASTAPAPADSSVATSGLSGLFDLVEKDAFVAQVVLTLPDGVRSLKLDREQKLSEVLANAQMPLNEFTTEDGKPANGELLVSANTTVYLFGTKYQNKFEKIKLPASMEEVESTSIPVGERSIVTKGVAGEALKTIVATNTLSKTSQAKTTELITVIKPPKPGRVLVGVEQVEDPEANQLGVLPGEVTPPTDLKLQYPVKGPITSPYGMRVHPVTGVYKLHDGTDFSSPCGTEVKPAAAGVVIKASMAGAYGNRVEIDHGGGFITAYNHLSAYKVEVGDAVDEASVVGLVGSTGYSTGCHLHLMTIQDGNPLDPMTFFK